MYFRSGTKINVYIYTHTLTPLREPFTSLEGVLHALWAWSYFVTLPHNLLRKSVIFRRNASIIETA